MEGVFSSRTLFKDINQTSHDFNDAIGPSHMDTFSSRLPKPVADMEDAWAEYGQYVFGKSTDCNID
jgi:hypothetical protein